MGGGKIYAGQKKGDSLHLFIVFFSFQAEPNKSITELSLSFQAAITMKLSLVALKYIYRCNITPIIIDIFTHNIK